MRKRTMTMVGGAFVAAAALTGGAVALAGGGDDGEGTVTGPDADRATAAALAETGGGTANAVERDSEDGATWEVEVTRPDGTTVDVRLDESFQVVVVETDGGARRRLGRPVTFRAALAGAAAALLVGVAAAAGTAGARQGYEPTIDPDEFTTVIDNPYLSFAPGARWVYEGDTPDGTERIVVEVTDQTRMVMDVETVVVRDTVTLDGVVIEDTFDWYAQHADGAVWYFGEDTTEFEDGVAVNHNGAWEAGVDGALPGIVMLVAPEVGDRYRQEYARGIAEDRASVLSVSARAAVPFGTFEDVLKTRDVNPLDRGPAEHKLYAKGVGLVLELAGKDRTERVELIEHTAP